jgi:hypothetical protein
MTKVSTSLMINHSYFGENKTHVVSIVKNDFYLLFTDQEGVKKNLVVHNIQSEEEMDSIIAEVESTDSIPEYIKEDVIDVIVSIPK